MDKRAFSPDGYIIDQRKTRQLQYGRYTSDWNGCGWIAAYNLLRYFGRRDSAETVNAALAAILPHQGRMGTPVRTMKKYLAAEGLPCRVVWTRRRILREIRSAPAGILRYIDEGAPHYVTFVRSGGEKWRFFNAIEGESAHVCTMAEFFRTQAPKYLVRAILPEKSARAEGAGTE